MRTLLLPSKLVLVSEAGMVDSNIDPQKGEGVRCDNVTADVVQRGANIYITTTADEGWLKSPERVYPVYIDPTTLSQSSDAYVSSAYPNTNYNVDWNSAGYYQLKCGYYDSTTGTCAPFIRFDITPIYGKLITAATFNIYTAHSYYATTPTGVWLNVVDTPWDPATITYNTMPANSYYANGYTTAVKGTWASFNVTDLVGNWVSDPPAAPTGTAYGNSANSASGYVNLTWNPVPGATGYKVMIFNGYDYEAFDVGNVTSWSSNTYTYNPDGTVASVTDASGSTTTYTYDGQNNLTSLTDLNGFTTTFAYDASKNRTAINYPNSTKITSTYDPAGKITAVKNLDPAGNPLFSFDYTYYDNGLIKTVTTSRGTTTYEYNPENQLTRVVKPNGDAIEFAYDGSGRRVSKAVNGAVIKYEYDGDLIAAETDLSDNTLATYTYDDKGAPISVTKNGQTYYFHYNVHGDVVALADAAGNVAASYEYDEWGNVTRCSGDLATPFGYAGQHGYVYDKETGLYFLKSRYYDPATGRIPSRDRFKGFENRPASQNPYTYCENDPVNKVDPEGYWSRWQLNKTYHFSVVLAGLFGAISFFSAFMPWTAWLTAPAGWAAYMLSVIAWGISLMQYNYHCTIGMDFAIGTLLQIAGTISFAASLPVRTLLGSRGRRIVAFLLCRVQSLYSAFYSIEHMRRR